MHLNHSGILLSLINNVQHSKLFQSRAKNPRTGTTQKDWANVYLVYIQDTNLGFLKFPEHFAGKITKRNRHTKTHELNSSVKPINV